MIRQLNSAVVQLYKSVGVAIAAIATLLIAISLGVSLLILRLIPYLLRLACIVMWTFGLWWCYSGIYTLYSPSAISYIQILAIFASVACLLIFVPVLAVRNKENVWAGFLGAGLLGIAIGVITRIIDGEQILLFASVAPVLLLGLFIFYFITRFKKLKIKEVSNE